MTSTPIQITVLKPASIDLPPTVSTVGIIDRSVYHPPDTLLANKIGEETDKDYFKDVEVIARESIEGFAALLVDSPRFGSG